MTHIATHKSLKQTMRQTIVKAVALLPAIALLPMQAAAQFNLQKQDASRPSSQVVTPHVRAELVAHAPEGVAAGKPLWLGLTFTHQPEWHTYWTNPGDAGLPTELAWRLPQGMDAGAIAWPLPSKFPLGKLVNYGYDGFVLLPVPVSISSAFSPGQAAEVDVKLHATWLMCRKECIPEEGDFVLKLPVRAPTVAHAAAFAAAAKAMPQPLPNGAGTMARVNGAHLEVEVAGLPSELRGKDLEVFSEVPGVVETAALSSQRWQGKVWTARLPLAAQRSASPSRMPFVLAHGGKGWRADLGMQGGWASSAAQGTSRP